MLPLARFSNVSVLIAVPPIVAVKIPPLPSTVWIVIIASLAGDVPPKFVPTTFNVSVAE